MDTIKTDIAIVQATPAGIAAAVAAARLGSRVTLTESTTAIGGLMSNGLGVTDIATRATMGGLFAEFIAQVRAHYIHTYGADSPQAKECSDGYHFEPHIAQQIFDAMTAGEPNLTIWKRHRLERVEKNGTRVTAVIVQDLERSLERRIEATVFLDATYEGDLAALAGVGCRLGREARKETAEPYAGVLYMNYKTKEVYEGTTGMGDNRIQAYNYRLCLTDRPDLRVLPDRPAAYRREDYTALLKDIRRGYLTHFAPAAGDPPAVFNVVRVPNGKSDTNNHHNSLLSTDLPEENIHYPTATYAERAQFLQRQRDYTLGLLWFCQNDPELPEAFRAEAQRWGLAKDEYVDNGHFPRQIYVREARRIEGEFTFSALDCLCAPDAERAPIHPDTVTAAHYPIDSHATRKREETVEGRDCLEGFLGLGHLTVPYDVPYGVMVPKGVEGLLVPVACSSTHMGFGTLRMEPCWMALGQAAGTAAHLARERGETVRHVSLDALQRRLLANRATLVYFRDLPATHPAYQGVQFWAARGFFTSYEARPDAALTRGQAALWLAKALRLPGADAHHLPFEDIKPDYLAAGAIAALQRKFVLEADRPRNEFRPAETLTWTEWNEWLHRAYGLLLEGLRVKIPKRPYLHRGEFCQILFEAARPPM